MLRNIAVLMVNCRY